MKISRLYLKIFLSFMLVLIVSEFILFLLLMASWSQSPRVGHMERQLITVKDLAELEIGSRRTSPEQEKAILTPLLKTVGRSMDAKIWITGPYGEVIASTDTVIPDMSEFTEGESARSHQGAYVFKKRHAGIKSIYGIYTSRFPEGYPFTYHLYHSFPKINEETWFMKGQLVLTLLAAICLIPVARRLISPLKKLTASAAKLGQGDLKQRVEIKGKDEIAELAGAFNHMTESLEKIVKSSRELTANVSHEIRSPLARMRITLEMLKERIEDGQTQGCDNFIDGMQSEIIHMDELIGKIIEFSKLDMHKSPSMNEIVDLKAMIDDLLAQYEHIAARNSLNVETDLEEIKLQNCNRNGIRIILDNILGNSFKYTEQEGSITVRLFREKNYTRIEVTNTHAPLEEKDLEEIFNPFHRLKGQEISGSGLGLAVARKIAHIHGGEINAENSGNGFRIIVALF